MSRVSVFWIILALIVSAVYILVLLLYIVSLKLQMKQLKNNLKLTRQSDNNQQMTVSLLDGDLSKLTTEINSNLDYQKRLKLESEQKEQQIRQSISDISHDLRTPLTVVKGNLQLLKQENLSGRGETYLEICLDKTEVLKEMVDDFFELSVLESESVMPELEKLDLTEFLMQFLIAHEAIIVKEELTPNLSLPEKSIFVMADVSMLERILSNLLNNTVKYAKDTFDVALVEKDEEVVLSFENAVEEDCIVDINQLFDRTYRADKARQQKGAGLGLYIVKLLAQKQKIKVSANQLGNTLCFQLRFVKV